MNSVIKVVRVIAGQFLKLTEFCRKMPKNKKDGKMAFVSDNMAPNTKVTSNTI